MIPMSEVPEKHPKLVSMFEEETGCHVIWQNRITENFKHWINQKIEYKNLKCKDPNCPRYGEEFPSKHSLANHITWHNKEYKKSHSGENNPMFGKHHSNETKRKIGDGNRGKVISEETKRKLSGKNNPMYGKCGKESPSFKENAKYAANHLWINRHFPQKTFCNDKCEVCDKFNLHLDLAQFVHINVRNIEDPMIDYFYVCPRREKNSCHRIYDKLNDEQKEELLAGAITREEKLERVRGYVLKLKKIGVK